MRFTQAPGGTGGTWVMLWINLVQQGGDQRLWEIKKKKGNSSWGFLGMFPIIKRCHKKASSSHNLHGQGWGVNCGGFPPGERHRLQEVPEGISAQDGAGEDQGCLQGSACSVSPIFHFCHGIYTWDKTPGGCARPGRPAKRSSLQASPNSLLQPWRGAGDRDRTWTQHFQPKWQQNQHPDGTGRMRPAVPSSVHPAAPTCSGCPFSQPGRGKPPRPQLSAARGLPKRCFTNSPSPPKPPHVPFLSRFVLLATLQPPTPRSLGSARL